MGLLALVLILAAGAGVVTTGNHVWAERFDRELEDLFAVQDEITETIVASIAAQLMFEYRPSEHSVTAPLW